MGWPHDNGSGESKGAKQAVSLVPPSLLFSCQVVSDLLQPHAMQHARLSCPSLSTRVCWVSDAIQPSPLALKSFPAACQAFLSFTIYQSLLSQWCHPTISSCSQIFPSIRVFSNESALCIILHFEGGRSPLSSRRGCCLLGWWDVLRVASRCCVCHVGRAWLGFAEREGSWRELLPKSYRDNILL